MNIFYHPLVKAKSQQPNIISILPFSENVTHETSKVDVIPLEYSKNYLKPLPVEESFVFDRQSCGKGVLVPLPNMAGRILFVKEDKLIYLLIKITYLPRVCPKRSEGEEDKYIC